MEPTKDTDTMSGIEPLGSSTATSALLQASPGSNVSKLSLSFGSYHSSLQSSPKNPDQFGHGESPRSRHLEQAISPLQPETSVSESSALNRHSQFGLSRITKSNDEVVQYANPGMAIAVTSLPNTPFNNNFPVGDSKRLMTSADESMLRDHYVNPHKYHPELHNQPASLPLHHTNRELFYKAPQGYPSNSDKKSSSAAYTSASRSYRTLYDKSVTSDKGGVESTRLREHKSNFPASSRNRPIEESSVQKNKTNYPEINIQTDQQSPAHQEIAEMERVCQSLHQMMSTSSRPQGSSNSTAFDLLAGELPSQEKSQFGSMDSSKTDALLSARINLLGDDLAPMGVDSGFGLSAYKSFASNMSQDVTETAARDTTLHAENHMLRDCLEKERFRRKHCEKQIAELQSKLLETQQQLAVAISTDKKKDAMIEQLDKTLARLVDGWKKQDQEKIDALGQLKSQKETAEEKLQELQNIYEKKTSEVDAFKETLEDVHRQTQQAMTDYESQIVSLQQERSSLTQQLQREQRDLQETHKHHKAAVDKLQKLQRELRQTQQSLLEEKEHQQTAEETLEEQMQSLEKEHKEALNHEKAQVKKQTLKAHEACELLTAMQRDVETLKEQLDSAIREKENARLELSLQEARFDAGQRKHEAEWQEEMEKTLNKRLTELQERAQCTEKDLQAVHRGQIADLQEQHQREVDEMRTSHQQEILLREKRLETLRQQQQDRLDECQDEVSKSNNKMEDAQHEKTLLVGKLQDVLQAYYSGALLDTGSQSASPLHQCQIKSPISTRGVITGDLFEESLLQPPTKEYLPTTPGRLELLEKPIVYSAGIDATKDSRNELTSAQIASLHSTIQLQHKHHQQSLASTASMLSNVSRTATRGDMSHRLTKDPQNLQNNIYRTPHDSNSAMHLGTSQNATAVGKTYAFRGEGQPTGAQPIRLQATSDGHVVRTAGDSVEALRFQDVYAVHISGQRDELPTLQQHPDLEAVDRVLDGGRGYTSGEFLPLKAVTGSPNGSILSTGPIGEDVSELSSLHPTRSNFMLLEKLAEHEQRQLALQHYIQMLLQRSPGTTETERNARNKPADTSAVLKERLPTLNDSSELSHWYNQKPVPETRLVVDQQLPSHQKAVAHARNADVYQRHIPAERLQSKPLTSQAGRPHTSTSGVTSNKPTAQNMGKSRAAINTQAQPSAGGRSSAPKSGKTVPAPWKPAAAPTRQSMKGKPTRVGPSRGSVTVESTGKKRGTRGKETK